MLKGSFGSVLLVLASRMYSLRVVLTCREPVLQSDGGTCICEGLRVDENLRCTVPPTPQRFPQASERPTL